MKNVLLIAALLILVACGDANMIDCIDGCSGGTPGPRGESIVGERGEKGESIVGAPGADANPVTVVKLCPGVTTYPSVFVEIAFCIGNKLYGTYSTHGGFSTEFPPGDYKSNAVGSQCNFQVKANCVVEPL